MSHEGSTSQSGSTNSSSSQLSFFQDNVTDLTLFGSPAPTFTRTGTVVRRANSIPFRKDRIESTSSTEDDDTTPLEKFRTDLTQYRHSLAAISERKNAKSSSFSSDSGKLTHRTFNSMETSSDNTDYFPRSSVTDRDREDKAVLMSPSSSSYLSWIESVNSGNFASAVSSSAPAQDIDNKVGEWNNFWLNYSDARLRHLSTEPTFSSDGDRTADETFEEHIKSQESTQRDVTDKNSVECIMLTLDEANETMRCSQRITEILQNAMKRSEVDETSNESYYSQQQSAKTSIKEDMSAKACARERSVSCVVDQQTLQKQKQLINTAQQSSSTSCINAILSTGVADILKKVILKRREVITSESETRSTTRSSFSEWSSR